MKENWKRLAYQDPLLGINNYIKFNKDLSETLAKEGFRKIAFWYCDIDNFKLFNESFGYEAGDQLLKSLAQLFDEVRQER
ncbi:MAG: GGDEF domain-containing protein [[Clostridium] scindens]